jgi:hypothetical protein
VAIAVIKAESRQVFGFVVDSPSRWYITDNFMVTHNTGKSRPALYASCVLGEIFKNPFDTKNIFWDLSELEKSIPALPYKSTIFKDEHRHDQSGYLAKQEMAHMNDLVEQLREPKQINFVFASVFKEIHADFYHFEAMNIDWSNDMAKPPKGFFSMLSTPRYTDSDEFVWRGMVYFPFPPEKIEKVYSERKREAQKVLENQSSSRLAHIEIIAKKIFSKKLPELVRETKNGIKIPLQADLMMLVIQKEPNIGGLTIPVLKMLIATLRNMIEQYYADDNAQIELKSVKEKADLKEQQRLIQEKLDLEKNEQRRARMELMRQRIEEMRLSRQLKERIRAEKAKITEETPSEAAKNREKLAENQEKAMKQA